MNVFIQRLIYKHRWLNDLFLFLSVYSLYDQN